MKKKLQAKFKNNKKRNICITVAYNGKNYVGWQSQKRENGISVQDTIEKALKRSLGHSLRINASGRTDTGVHAWGQTANFYTYNPMALDNLIRATQNFLPSDIQLRKAQEVDADFHACFVVKKKTYRYYLALDPGNLFNWDYFWYIPKQLNIEVMIKAARLFEGAHNFSAFSAKNDSYDENKVYRTLDKCRLSIEPAQIGDLPWQKRPQTLCLEVKARGFLYRMVRALAGAIVAVGSNKLSLDKIEKLLKSGGIMPMPIAPAHGLILWAVDY